MSTENATEGRQSESQAAEDRERERAWRRGEGRASDEDATRSSYTGKAPPAVAARAFAALAENTRDYAIFLMDPDGVITFWGEGARLIKWWTKAEAEGAHLRLLYPSGGSDDGTAEAHLQQAAEHGEYTGEGHRVRSDGSKFWAGVTLTALWDEDGTLLGFAKVTRDLTARRAADGLLQAAAESAETARAEAVAASAAKSGFLATMSHEIRTPINAILGYHDLLDLEVDGPLTLGQRRHLARARASARHLLDLVTEVLDFSRIEADHVLVGQSVFRVGDVVSSALSLVEPQARARGIELADSVSGYAAGLAAWGDEARVRQVLVNLLANAVKFTSPRNDEAGRVAVSAGTATEASPDARLPGAGPWVYVRVEDTGMGIAPDQLEPIFEPFVQADMRLTRAHGGTGLGLAISRRLARLMGGDITVRSEQEVGSTFFLWLPAAPVASLQTGGLEGHGPGGELSPGDETPGPEVEVAAELAATTVEGTTTLRAVSDAVLTELERVLHAYVARVRSDAAIPSAHAATDAQIEDHLGTFLADLAGTLTHMDGVVSTGEPSAAVRDGTAIQRLVAMLHGAQRARLGWSEAELRREFTILREELADALRRRSLRDIPGPTPQARVAAAGRAVELLEQFVAVAERLSIGSFREATQITS